jgi:hypothetical protein
MGGNANNKISDLHYKRSFGPAVAYQRIFFSARIMLQEYKFKDDVTDLN